MEVLNEGKIRKRKHQKADRCHRDDEKERRKDIAEQFERLKSFLPETKKNRTRQEVLSRTRELIWVSSDTLNLVYLIFIEIVT